MVRKLVTTTPDRRRVLVIDTEWNDFIVRSLKEGAFETLAQAGLGEDDIHHLTVPGAFEVPMAAKLAAEGGRYDAIVALGAVIRGATPHFDYVAGEAAKGLSAVMMQTGVPVAFGILTVDTIEQAIERAGTKAGNKGREAAGVALRMIDVVGVFAGGQDG